MPVYNGEQFLSESIESILKQTFADFEYLIINDGSTDGSEQIIKNYAVKDNRIRYVENEANLGLVKTLNKGLKLAKGKYIARMDADDLSLPERFQKQFDFMESHPEIAICGTSFKSFGTRNATHIYPETHDEIRAGLLFGSCICHPSVFFRNTFIQEHGIKYIEETFPAEDYKIWVMAAKIGKLYNLPEVLLHYREHETQISTEQKQWQKEKTNLIRIEMLEYLSDNFSPPQLKYHLNHFIPGKIYNRNDLKKYEAWAKVLLRENKTNSNFDHASLKARLRGHKYNTLLRQVNEIFFSENKYNPERLIRYIGSSFFFRITLKQNIKILRKCISFRVK